MTGRPPAPIPGQPPSLPSRRPPPRPPSPDAEGSDEEDWDEPAEGEEYYSEFHGEADIEDSSGPPPPPPSRRPGPPPPPVTEELYDDFDLQDGKTALPSPPPQQDIYEVTDDVSPPPPPLPGNRPAPRLPSFSAPPPLPPGGDEAEEVYADPDEVSQPEVYEAVNESPAPPPVPPNRNRRDPPPKPEVPAGRPEPKPTPPPPMGGLVIDANSLQSKLGNLRRTNAKSEEKSSPGSGKIYAEKSTFQDKKNLFERRSSTVSAEDVGPKSPPASKSPVDSKSPHIVTLSKPSLPSRPSVPTTLPPPKPPLSRPGPRSPDSSGDSLKSPIAPKPPESPPANDADDGELYDDGSSFQIFDPLVGNSWYFPRVDRKESEKKLNKFIHQDGTFLLRKSTKDPNKPYTLDVVYEKRIYHLQVRLRPDKNYALGSEKDDEMHFGTVKDLVEHHKMKEVILIGEHPGKVLLQRWP